LVVPRSIPMTLPITKLLYSDFMPGIPPDTLRDAPDLVPTAALLGGLSSNRDSSPLQL
jgi:hypothetical protein